MVKSISYDQTEIINWILDLHVPSHHIDCDPTYSKGNFYSNTGIEYPQYKSTDWRKGRADFVGNK